VLRELTTEGPVHIVGGCRGTTPKHIGALARGVGPLAPRRVQATRFCQAAA